MLYLVKLEDLEQRYTIQMHSNLVEQAVHRNIPFRVVEGAALSGAIDTGAFLDSNSTVYYKATQVEELAKKFSSGIIKNGDTFLVYDGWFPGITSLRYMAYFAGVEINIVGIFHAGTWEPSDFITGLRPRVGLLEKHWLFESYDKILVGSEWHKKRITKVYPDIEYKIFVTGLPFWSIDPVKQRCRDIKSIVYASRFHREKGFVEFLDAVIADDADEYNFKVTSTSGNIGNTDIPDYYVTLYKELVRNEKLVHIRVPTKAAFYSELSSCGYIFSFPEQEGWGYSMLEAVSLGCTPLVRRGLSYDEMFCGLDLGNPREYYKVLSAIRRGSLVYNSIDPALLYNGNIYKGAAKILAEVA